MRGSIGWTIAFVATIVLTRLAVAKPPASYEFFLDDEPIEPRILSLHGEPDRPRPGDLVTIGEFTVVLDDPGPYRFTKKRDRLVLRLEHRLSTVVALRLLPRDPLPRNAPPNLRSLILCGGVRPREVPDLSRLDLDGVCVTLRGGRFDKLPAGVRHLVLRGATIRKAPAAERLASLWSLRLDNSPFVDLSALGAAKGLRVLAVSEQPLPPQEVWPGLSGLRHLDLRGASDLQGVPFVRAMKELRYLDIESTAVDDLRPLSDHPALRVVRANAALVRHLPAGRLPSLRELRALSVYSRRRDPPAVAPVPEAEAASFRARNPHARLLDRWEPLLAEAAKGARRLRIRTGGTC